VQAKNKHPYPNRVAAPDLAKRMHASAQHPDPQCHLYQAPQASFRMPDVCRDALVWVVHELPRLQLVEGAVAEVLRQQAVGHPLAPV
jgi:hypothetical protein